MILDDFDEMSEEKRLTRNGLGFSVLSRQSTVTTDIGLEPSHIRELRLTYASFR